MANKIRFEDNIWVIPLDNKTYWDKFKIDFEEVKNATLRNECKKLVREILKHDTVKTGSLLTYWGKFKNYFLPFIDKMNRDINYFSDITKEDIDVYIFHLKALDLSPSSKSTTIASLKSFINTGIEMRLPNYPSIYIFPDSTADIFGVDDVLYTKYLELEIIEQIRESIDVEKDLYFKSAVKMAIETGLRISEILTIQKGCILEDFEGHPVLYTYSLKINEEIYQAVNDTVVDIVKELENNYSDNPNEYLFFKNGKLILQSTMRIKLKRFSEKNGLPEGINFHAFRHTLGTDMINSGSTTHQVRTQLNHKSYHSTNLYAKIKSTTVDNEYYQMGILGLDENNPTENIQNGINKLGCRGSLADGECKNILNEDGEVCIHFNRCLRCNQFVAFEEDFEIHKSHLERLKKDREQYMYEEGLTSIEILSEIELALESIIGGESNV